jgi:hypothetical protein
MRHLSHDAGVESLQLFLSESQVSHMTRELSATPGLRF